MGRSDELTTEEQKTLMLASTLREAESLRPLITLMRDGTISAEQAGDALQVLAELDLDLLVEGAVDLLVSGVPERA